MMSVRAVVLLFVFASTFLSVAEVRTAAVTLVRVARYPRSHVCRCSGDFSHQHQLQFLEYGGGPLRHRLM